MYDILPFPNTLGKTTEEQVAEINNYLIQLKENLEFVLTDISVDNLSQELIDKLNSLGADVEKSYEENEDKLSQIASNSLTISDVVDSETFSSAIESKIQNIKFSVNFETGNLEYEIKEM